MRKQEVWAALRGVDVEKLTDFMENMGWSLQETNTEHNDVWTKMKRNDVSEIRLPESGAGPRDAGQCPEAADAVMKLAEHENLSHRYILQKVAPENMGPEPTDVILEDVRRSAVRKVLAEQAQQNTLLVMEKQNHDEPRELQRLLWAAHSDLRAAQTLMEEIEQGHVARLVERLQENG